MKAPYFWYKKSILSTLLRPFSWIYQISHRWNWRRVRPYHASVPVICVGNVVLGGAGKTPCVMSIAKFFLSLGYSPHIVSRGYKGTFSGRVCLEQHSFKEVGDEPLLLARIAPTWVGKDRVQSAKNAIKEGATHLILDDGFQNPRLYKDFSILIENNKQKCGNGLVFPAGPLREPALSAVKRAHYIWNIEEKMLGNFVKDPVIAFSGIGYPQKFFDGLKQNGINLIKIFAYSDHYPYKEKDIKFLMREAHRHNAKLATTAKDAVRLQEFQYLLENYLVFDVAVEIPQDLASSLSFF